MKKNKGVWTGFIVVIVALIGSTFIPTGYDVLHADAPLSLNEFVQYVDGYEMDGELGMTFVSALENTIWPFLLIAYLVEDGVEIEPASSEALEMDLEELHYQYLTMMEQSKIKAEYIAREYVGETPKLELIGFYPVHYIPDWPYKDEVKVSDILVEIDGVKPESIDQAEDIILEKEPDEEITLTVLREGVRTEIIVRTYPYLDYYGNTTLGVYVEEVFELEQDDRIQLNVEDVGGPSAGLMMTLTLLEKMTEESLLKGNKVAGTGTIEMSGEVGPIGGVKQKVIGADLAGYDYFLVPEDNEYGNNEELARRTVEEEGLSIKVIPIGTLAEAVKALRDLPEKK